VAAHSDFITSLGPAFLAHRLRRLSETLLQASAEVMSGIGFTGPARSVSTLLLLDAERQLAITEIAARLCFSHPLIVNLVHSLVAEGYAEEHKDPNDARRRLVSLTSKGRAQATILRKYNGVVEEVILALGADAGADLYGDVEKIEAALITRSFTDRLKEAMPFGPGASL
jgi:MarR family transcriptional regulator, organic hydroperoxide resistance regulator